MQWIFSQLCGYWYLVLHQGISSHSAEYVTMHLWLFMVQLGKVETTNPYSNWGNILLQGMHM